MAVLFLIAVRQGREGPDTASVHREEGLPARPERAVPCILLAASPAEGRPQGRVPASGSVLREPDAPALGSVLAVDQEWEPALCRLPARHRAPRAQDRAHAAAASSIRRPKKAR